MMNVQVRSIIRDAFPGYDRLINADTRFDADIMADSMDMIGLALRIENATGVVVDDALIEDIQTVGELESWLADRVAA